MLTSKDIVIILFPFFVNIANLNFYSKKIESIPFDFALDKAYIQY